MRRRKNKTLVYLILILTVIVLILAAYTFLKVNYFGENYQRALASENPLDKCKTPEGYTDETWREHMSHHPDVYRECLE